MTIAKSVIVAVLNQRHQPARAAWAQRVLPDEIDPAHNVGLLATLNISPDDLATHGTSG